MINSGSGNDTVSYYGSESVLDGGGGNNTLLLQAVTTVNLGNVDQTTGDATSVANFQNVDASGLSASVSITGSSVANIITAGSGNDTIDGAGGADVINAGAGNDFVSYYGSEDSIDGGAGTNTLVMRAAANVNLGNADQTTGDTASVSNFQNVDASGLSSALSITGSSGANVLTGGTGDDSIDGGGGADVIAAGSGNDTVTYRGTETSIDGGTGADTLVLAASGGTTAVNFSVATNVDQTTGDSVNVTNFENLDASAVNSALSVIGSVFGNTITTGAGNDTIDGGGGADIINAGGGNDTVSYYGTENVDRRRRRQQHAGAEDGGHRQSRQRRSDCQRRKHRQQLPERRCVGAIFVGLDHRFRGRQRHHRRIGQRRDRRRRRRRYHQRAVSATIRSLTAAPRRRSTVASAPTR